MIEWVAMQRPGALCSFRLASTFPLPVYPQRGIGSAIRTGSVSDHETGAVRPLFTGSAIPPPSTDRQAVLHMEPPASSKRAFQRTCYCYYKQVASIKGSGPQSFPSYGLGGRRIEALLATKYYCRQHMYSFASSPYHKSNLA